MDKDDKGEEFLKTERNVFGNLHPGGNRVDY